MYSHWELKFPDKISVSSLEKTGKDLHKVTIDFNNFEEVHKLTCQVCVERDREPHYKESEIKMAEYVEIIHKIVRQKQFLQMPTNTFMIKKINIITWYSLADAYKIFPFKDQLSARYTSLYIIRQTLLQGGPYSLPPWLI